MENLAFESPFEKVWLTESPLEIDTANMTLRIQCSRIVYSRHEELYKRYHSHDFLSCTMLSRDTSMLILKISG